MSLKFELSDNQLAEIPLILYLGTAPVFWLPHLPLSVVGAVKILLYLCVVVGALILTYKRKTGYVPLGMVGLGGFLLLLVFYIPGFLQSGIMPVLDRTLDILFAMVFFLVIFNARELNVDIPKVLISAAVLVTAFSVVPVMANYGIIPEYPSPIHPEFTITDTGLGGVSTGWSNGLSLYIPFLLYAAYRYYDRKSLLLFFIVLVGIVFMNQFVVGGRSGMLATVLMISTFLSFRIQGIHRVYTLGGVMVLLLVAFAYSDVREIQEHLRLDRITARGTVSVAAVDHFSAGRVRQYLLAVEDISKNPFLGYGLEAFRAKDYDKELHNVWLRLWYESGVLLLIVFMTMVYLAIRNKNRGEDDYLYFCKLCLIGGAFIALFEPNVLLGSFQNSAIWWVAYSLR